MYETFGGVGLSFLHKFIQKLVIMYSNLLLLMHFTPIRSDKVLFKDLLPKRIVLLFLFFLLLVRKSFPKDIRKVFKLIKSTKMESLKSEKNNQKTKRISRFDQRDAEINLLKSHHRHWKIINNYYLCRSPWWSVMAAPGLQGG